MPDWLTEHFTARRYASAKYAVVVVSVYPPVCPSVTSRHCTETTLVFCYQNLGEISTRSLLRRRQKEVVTVG